MAHKTSVGLRNRIIKTYNKDNGPARGKIKRVMDKTGCTYYQVYNAVSGRIKLDSSPRSDKGSMRKADSKILSSKKPEDFENLEDFLEHQLMVSAKDLAKRKYSPDIRIKLIKEMTRMRHLLVKQKIEGWIRRPEAVLIVRIMKRLNSKLTDEEIKKIYAEEYEKVQRDLN